MSRTRHFIREPVPSPHGSEAEGAVKAGETSGRGKALQFRVTARLRTPDAVENRWPCSGAPGLKRVPYGTCFRHANELNAAEPPPNRPRPRDRGQAIEDEGQERGLRICAAGANFPQCTRPRAQPRGPFQNHRRFPARRPIGRPSARGRAHSVRWRLRRAGSIGVHSWLENLCFCYAWFWGAQVWPGASCCPGARPSGRFTVRTTRGKQEIFGLSIFRALSRPKRVVEEISKNFIRIFKNLFTRPSRLLHSAPQPHEKTRGHH
jgi:hypothetical protein